ncbi:MAG: hypothetical protein RIS53_164 [Bacillota bacterium]|jgi:hypothetical protein
MGFFVSLIIFIAIDALVSSVLVAFGVALPIVDLVVSLTVAFVFAYMNSQKPVLTNIQFHKNFAFIFVVLLLMRYLFNYA